MFDLKIETQSTKLGFHLLVRILTLLLTLSKRRINHRQRQIHQKERPNKHNQHKKGPNIITVGLLILRLNVRPALQRRTLEDHQERVEYIVKVGVFVQISYRLAAVVAVRAVALTATEFL